MGAGTTGPRGLRDSMRAFLTPPEGLVAWLRWLALFYGLMNLSVVLAVLTTTSGGMTDTVVGVLTVVVLAGYLLWGYTGRAYVVPADALAAVALFFIGLPLATPIRAFAVFSAVLGFRALYGQERRIAPTGGIYAAAFVPPCSCPPLRARSA